MIGAAFLLGTSFSGGIVGVIQLEIVLLFIRVCNGSIINIACVIGFKRTATAAVSFITMPLLFLSGMFVPLDLVPPWIEKFAAFNPLNWAVEAGREVITSQPDWDIVIRYSSYLLLMFSIACVFVLLAFRKYQKTL